MALGPAVGEVLPAAVGVAISPVPIIATILMLLSDRAKRTAPAFAIGWLAGAAVALTLFAFVGGLLPADDGEGPGPWAAGIQGVLGVLLLLLAVKQWKSRPAEGETPAMPKWMASLTSIEPSRAAAMGFALASLNPKNLALAAGAGVALAASTQASDAASSTAVIAGVVWVVIASVTVAGPVVVALAAPQKMAAPLESLRVWLTNNNSAVMCVLFLVLGVNLISKALSAL